MREVTVAATQMACSWNIENNVEQALDLVREAAARGAQIVLLQELFETPYFCIDQDTRHCALAKPFEGHPTIRCFSQLAAELGVVVPVSFFERAGQVHFNTVAVIDADGSVLGLYRKSHIPNAVGYQEKHYFAPGDTGFRAWETRFGTIGVAVCWDQWFPEAARIMALRGAEILLYPTAIGSEPAKGDQQHGLESRDHWQRVQQGHAAANLVPVVASNRIGVESGDSHEMSFYGSSFIADHTGEIVAMASEADREIVTATLDLDAARDFRPWWGLFRDRRPELYGALLTTDGRPRVLPQP